jgi:hypothetical protein
MKLFRQAEPPRWSILEKEVIDEIIFRTTKARNRLLLELMARGVMRVGEVLKLTPQDVKAESSKTHLLFRLFFSFNSTRGNKMLQSL